VTGRILTAERINAHNTFDQPEQVKPTKFGAVKLEGTELTATLPPKAVVVLEIE
jgi:alpha-N-arabinofuranosidase